MSYDVRQNIMYYLFIEQILPRKRGRSCAMSMGWRRVQRALSTALKPLATRYSREMCQSIMTIQD